MAVKKLFTKEPWIEILNYSNRFSIGYKASNDKTETIANLYWNYHEKVNGKISFKEAEANFKLLFAAPDMLDCIEAMMDGMVGTEKENTIFWNQCNDTVFKATGEYYKTPAFRNDPKSSIGFDDQFSKGDNDE